MGLIKEELLLKAQRDKSKLVQVQRSVSRGGKTFMQNFWVSPSQVKSTDKVIGGQQNLLPTPGSVPTPKAGVLDKTYFDSIKSDKTKALDYLKSCGITWNEHTHAGINWMRAMQAFSTALGVQNGQKSSSQGNTQTTQSKPQIAQNNQSGGQNTNAVLKQVNQVSKMLDQSTWNELNACKNGKEKVVVLKKKLGQDGCMKFAESLGVTWDKHTHVAINNMRMSMALQQHFDKVDGTVSPTKQKGNKGGAPKGNQNAKKDTAPVDDKLEIPAGASERKKNIINAINSITDSEKLELVAKSGFVPEDDSAAEFIKKSLLEEYQKIIKNTGSGSSDNLYYTSGSSSLAQNISDSTTKMFTGLTKKVMKKALRRSSLLDEHQMYQLMYPRESMAVQEVFVNKGSMNKNNSLSYLLSNSRFFGSYASNSVVDDAGKPTTCNNVGYYGVNLEKSKAQFDMEKEGFVKILRQISSQNPDLKSETDLMETKYKSLMEKVDGNSVLLETLLDTSDYRGAYNAYKEYHDREAKEKQAFELIKTELEKQGLTSEEMEYTLDNHEIWSGKITVFQKGFYSRKLDANGNEVKIDLSNVLMPDGTPALDSLSRYSLKSRYLGTYYSVYDKEISESDYDEIISTAYDLVGVKLVDKTTGIEPTTKHHERMRSDYADLMPVPVSNNKNLDCVLSNLQLIISQHDFNSKIHSYLHELPNSKANNNGIDYNGNFNYYSPESPRNSFSEGYSRSAVGTNSIIPDIAEENAIIDKQLSRTTIYSSDYFENLRQYAEHDGKPDFKKNIWGDTYASQKEASAHSISLLSRSFSISSSNPAMNLLMDQLADAAQYCPQNYNTRVTTHDKVKSKSKEKVGHVRYEIPDYNAKTTQAVSNLRALREKAFKSANCTLASVDANKRTEIEHEVKINFDRIDAKTGKRVHKGERIYDNRTLVFHSGVYEIKNSQMEEDFQKESVRLGETPRHSYHGTSYSGACGILGVDGRFRYKDSDRTSGQKRSGSMLGEGIYVAKLVGKCCPYIGSNPYAYTSYTANDTTTPNNCSDGVILVCDTVFGKYGEFMDSNEARRNNKNNGGTYDSVAVGAGALMPHGGKLKEYECIVTRQNMIAPKYIVDCGARRR